MGEQREVAIPPLWSAAVGAFFGLQGLWAFLAPRSFFDALATFEPYNAHLIRDIGTMQVGLGVAGLAGSRRVPAVVVALAGLTAFQVLHVASHVIDRDDGGRPLLDITGLSVLALLTMAALVRARRRSAP